MALTKAQVSLVTVATLGIAPGGFTADLQNFGSQNDIANLIATLGTPEFTTYTNAEFALKVAENLGAADASSLFNALEGGATRADAAVAFANAQLVAQGGSIANVDKAIASTSTSTDLNALKAEISDPAKDGLIVEFKDNESDQAASEDGTGQTIVNIGKAQADAGSVKKAEEFTFKLKNQIGADDNFIGKFLSSALNPTDQVSTGSQIVLQLINLREPEGSTTPLKDLPTQGITFDMGGVKLLVQSDDIKNATTYNQLSIALQARIDELAAGAPVVVPPGVDASSDPADYEQLVNLKVTVGTTFDVFNNDGKKIKGNEIVITNSGEQILKPLTIENDKDAPIKFTIHGEMSDQPGEADETFITTNLEATNVGYDSQGGSVNIVGQSNSDKGIQELKLTANGGVWFSRLESKGKSNHLQKIELQSGSEGYFRVGTQENSPNHVVNLTEQNFNAAGLVDVREVDAQNAGRSAINAYVSDKVIARDYNVSDVTETKNIKFDLTVGDDVLNLAVDQNVMSATATQVNINTSAGNDVVHFQVSNGLNADGTIKAANGGNWLANQALLDNVRITTGDGNDQVVLTGAGNVNVWAGTGDDEVRADNTGDRAVFLFNANGTTDIDALINTDNTLGGGNKTDVFNNATYKTITVNVDYLGFKGSFTLDVDSTGKVTTQNINDAIKQAIAGSNQLDKLLAVHDNAGGALGVESKVDGLRDANSLKISFTATNQNDLVINNPAGTLVLNQYTTTTIATLNGVAQAGSASASVSDNRIDLGTGDDLVMMGTGANSNDTLVITKGNASGTKTIVNFDKGATSTGQDYFDVSSFFDGTFGAKVTHAQLITGISPTGSPEVLRLNANGELTFYPNGTGTGQPSNAIATLDFGTATPSYTTATLIANVDANGNLSIDTNGLNATALTNLTIKLPNLTAGVDNLTMSAAQVIALNALGLTDLTFDFKGLGANDDLVTLAGGTLALTNLTVTGGELDVTALGTNFNVTGTITLNSGLTVSVAQYGALSTAGVTITSKGTGTFTVEINSAADVTAFGLITNAINLAGVKVDVKVAPGVDASTIVAKIADLETAYSVEDSLENLLELAKLATGNAKAGLVEANSIIATGLGVVEFTGLDATNAATAIDFGGAATLTAAQVEAITTTLTPGDLTAGLTAGDAITVTGVDASNLVAVTGALGSDDTIVLANNTDISALTVGGSNVKIDLDAANDITVTMTAAQLATAITDGLTAQATDTINVKVLPATTTATATAAIDVFTLAAAPTGALAIANMAAGDKLNVSGFAADVTGTAQAAKADVDAAGEWFIDTATGMVTFFDGTNAVDITLTGVTGVTVDAGVFTVA